MSEASYVQAVIDLTTAVNESYKWKGKLPAFILLYSAMDIFASLSRPLTQEDTSGEVFKKWVADYLLPGSGLTCNDEDLWGARCGILHTYTVQSKNSRKGIARELHYICVGDRNAVNYCQQRLDPKCERKIFIFLPDLIIAFLTSVNRFGEAIQKDAALRNTVFKLADKLAVHVQQSIPPQDQA